MSAAVIDLKNPIEVREAGLKALNDSLGPEAAQVFLKQYKGGVGDFTKERQEMPEPSLEEFTAMMREADAEIMARQRIA